MAEALSEDETSSLGKLSRDILRLVVADADVEKWTHQLGEYCMSVRNSPSIFDLSFESDHANLSQLQKSLEDKDTAGCILKKIDEIKDTFKVHGHDLEKVRKYQSKYDNARKELVSKIVMRLEKGSIAKTPEEESSVNPNAFLEFFLTHVKDISSGAGVSVSQNGSDLQSQAEKEDVKRTKIESTTSQKHEGSVGREKQSEPLNKEKVTEAAQPKAPPRSKILDSKKRPCSKPKNERKETNLDTQEFEPKPGVLVPQNPTLQQKTEESNSKGNSEKSNSEALKGIIYKLGLSGWFPEAITFTEIIKIVNFSKQQLEPQELTQLSWTLLRKLFSYDGRGARPDSSILMKRTCGSQAQGVKENSDNEINPIDVLFSCYLCCDKEVQQMFCKILFACKLSFPFIYRRHEDSLVISSWSLRDIILQFRNENGQYIEASLVSDCQFPVVSFVRIGEVSVSKSKLLNSLLNGNSHETFFHRDCTNGHIARICSNGLVEATVFLPSKTSIGSGMTRVFLAANLRGDFLEFEEQARVLADVSEAIVVFVNLEVLKERECLTKLRQLSKAAKIIIVVFKAAARQKKSTVREHDEDDQKLIASLSTVVAFSGKKTKSERELLDDLRRALGPMLVHRDLSLLPHQCEHTDCDKLVRGTTKIAIELLSRMDEADQQRLSQECLPLTTLWQNYSQLLRNEYNKKSQDDIEESREKRTNLRNEQITTMEKSRKSALVLAFSQKIGAACDCKDSGLTAKLYLQCIKLKLDEKSREKIPALLERKRELRDQLSSKQERERLDAKQKLEELEYQLRSSSIGLEHLLREVGQLFEAVGEAKIDISPEMADLANHLPRCFANLLLCGVPLEILDGDAGNIPSAWISAILKSCQELVGDKKIYVISVLGLQSSGKSTLLNTMFGLKFAVSAGRCTRGAFLQLVPVESGMPFDYIAVIDTEGLRAPELGLNKHHHDNELATLVIGLGDVTIINIKGENAAEMKDILQIAIHAFIRMKMANKKRDLQRHCIFIHQNVPAAGARELMQEATFKMQQTLDDMTKEAAEGEGLRDVKRFGDILEFNRDTDIFFMSDLWQGDPPMAPVNPGYSMDVQSIKKHLLHVLDNEQKSYLGFVDFSHRVKDLWKAILSEDFVFSFRNSIERKVYNMLERKFLDVMSHIEESVEVWLQNSASNSIRTCLNSELISVQYKKSKEYLRCLLNEKYENAVRVLDRFFKESPYQEYLLHYRDRMKENLKCSCQNLEIETLKSIEKFCSKQRAVFQQVSRRQEWEEEVVRRGNELSKGRKNISADQLRSEFDKVWQKLDGRFASESNNRSFSIEKEIIDRLQAAYLDEQQALAELLRETPISLMPNSSIKESVEKSIMHDSASLFTASERAPGGSNESRKHRTFTTIRESEKLLKTVIRKIPDEGLVTKQYIVAIQKMIQDGWQTQALAKLREENINVTVELEIRLTVIGFRFAFPALVAMDSKFYNRNGQQAKLAESKRQMWNLFEGTVRGKCESEIVAEYCLGHLHEILIRYVNARIGGQLQSTFLNDIGRTKYHLIVRMLSAMAESEDFALLAKYIDEPYESALHWLHQFLNDTFFRDHGDSSFVSAVESLIDPVLEKTERAAREAAGESKSLKEWIRILSGRMSADIHISPDDLAQVGNYKSATMKEVVDFFSPGINSLKISLIERFANLRDVKDVHCGDTDLCSSVLRKIWGCQQQCPFCREPCCKSLADHFDKDGSPHHCVQHRPQGVSGWHWVATGEFLAYACGSLLYAQRGAAGSTFSCSACSHSTRPDEICRLQNFDANRYHRYSDYKKYFPDWDITPDANNSESIFWNWFAWRFKEDLARAKGIRMDRIPRSWSLISKNDAIQSLRSLN